MFVIHFFDCNYFDTKNTNRNPSRDYNEERKTIKVSDAPSAAKLILNLFRQMGDIQALHPKIIEHSENRMWIECDSPYRIKRIGGTTDIVCAAIQIEYRPEHSASNDDRDELPLAILAKTLGDNFQP